MQTKVYTLPVESSEIWVDYKTFKEYVAQFVPNLSSVSQIACPWGAEKGRKYWYNSCQEVFRPSRPKRREEFCEETLKAGKVIVSVFTTD